MTERITRGPIGWEVARFGAPLAIGMGLQTAFNLVDAFILGRLEHGAASAALGAIGICDQLSALGTIVSYGLSVATAAILSRKKGEDALDEVRRVAWQSLLLVLSLSAIFGVIAIFGAGALMRDVVGAKGQVAVLGTKYLRVMVGGSLTIFLLLHLTTIQRALGSSKTPIAMLVGANFLNFVLAVLLVYGPGPAPSIFAWGPPISRALGIPRLELMGAAWATIIARAVFLGPLIFILIRRFDLFRRPSWTRPNPDVLRKIWKIGWPTSVQLVVRIFAMLAMQSIVARAFTTDQDQSATTALGIVFRLETMALFVGLGWGSAAQTFMGQNLGANEPDRAKASGWYAMAYNAVMMALLAVLYRIDGAGIIGFFDSTASVVSFATGYLVWIGPTYVALGVGIVLGSAIQGAGASKETLKLDSLVVLCLQVPVALLVVFAWHMGPVRLWQVVGATYVAYSFIYVASYRRGKFLKTAMA